MRTFSVTSGPMAAALAVALLTAGCDRLQWPTTTTHDEASRYETTKDGRGRLVRLDKVTGKVTMVNGTKAPLPATATLPAAARAARRARTASEPSLQPQPTSAPARPAVSKPAAGALPPVPTPIAFGELCGNPGERVAVTLVDTGVYARPNLGTPLVGRVVSGTLVTIAGDSGQWLRATLERRRGPLSGFVHCTALRPLTPGGTPDSDPETGDQP